MVVEVEDETLLWSACTRQRGEGLAPLATADQPLDLTDPTAASRVADRKGVIGGWSPASTPTFVRGTATLAPAARPNNSAACFPHSGCDACSTHIMWASKCVEKAVLSVRGYEM